MLYIHCNWSNPPQVTMDEVRELIYNEILEYHPMAMQAHISGGSDIGYDVRFCQHPRRLPALISTPFRSTSHQSPYLNPPRCPSWLCQSERSRWLQEAIHAPREQPR